jgi:hypothetical protein
MSQYAGPLTITNQAQIDMLRQIYGTTEITSRRWRVGVTLDVYIRRIDYDRIMAAGIRDSNAPYQRPYWALEEPQPIALP